jgi:NAD(P)-dependent dehydrogenase (short-subunit alcohol dehydrogenase family)
MIKRSHSHCKGIGRATAISFALEGCPSVAICDRNLEGLHETEKYMREVSAHCEILVYQVDMLLDDQIEGMVEAAVSKWGRIDYAVNAAGRNLIFTSRCPAHCSCLNVE